MIARGRGCPDVCAWMETSLQVGSIVSPEQVVAVRASACWRVDVSTRLELSFDANLSIYSRMSTYSGFNQYE